MLFFAKKRIYNNNFLQKKFESGGTKIFSQGIFEGCWTRRRELDEKGEQSEKNAILFEGMAFRFILKEKATVLFKQINQVLLPFPVHARPLKKRACD